MNRDYLRLNYPDVPRVSSLPLVPPSPTSGTVEGPGTGPDASETGGGEVGVSDLKQNPQPKCGRRDVNTPQVVPHEGLPQPGQRPFAHVVDVPSLRFTLSRVTHDSLPPL